MLKFNYDDRTFEVHADMFAFDGCHKIYLITSSKDESEALDYGYELRGVNELPEAYEQSCGLRFISFWDVENIKGNLVPQCFDAEIERDGNDVVVSLELPDDWAVYMEDWINGFLEKGVLTYI